MTYVVQVTSTSGDDIVAVAADSLMDAAIKGLYLLGFSTLDKVVGIAISINL